MINIPKKALLASLCATFVTGCATDPITGRPILQETFASDDPCSNNARNVGIAIGAIAGAILANQMEHSNTSRILGIAAGGAIGGLIGSDIDRRRCELYKIAKKNNLDMQIEDIKALQLMSASNAAHTPSLPKENSVVGMRVSVRDNNRQFVSGSDQLTKDSIEYFSQIAETYSYTVQLERLPRNANKSDRDAVEILKTKKILLVGHTDDTGGSRLNADLSERRAKSVAKIFYERGISESNLYFQGAGETLPVADNRTDDGRAHNRRVEIIDLTDDAALWAYLSGRTPILAYYRNAEQPKMAHTDTAQQPVKAVTVKHVSKLPSPPSPTVASKTSKPAVASTAQAIATKTPEIMIDFGGNSDLKNVKVDIGKVTSSGGVISLISSAYADQPIVGSCFSDHPRISNGVKSLSGEKKFETAEYMPGLYKTSWTDNVNGHLVAVTNVAVLRDGGVPANKPDLRIYRDYKPGVPVTYSSTPEVNAYRGDKATLYRMFVDGPVKCIDMVIPNAQSLQAKDSHIYYSKGSTLFGADFNPKMVITSK